MLYVYVRNGLHRNRTGNPSIGIIIIGNMERGMFAKRIVHLHPDLMDSSRNVLYHCRKWRIRIIMVNHLHTVEVYIRGMTNALENQTDISPPLTVNLSAVNSFSTIARKIRMLLPAARNRHLIHLICANHGKPPDTIKLLCLSDSVPLI